MYNVLTLSRNTRLLMGRNDTLALAGFRVVSPRIPEEAPHLALQQKVEALIIGHSVEPELRTRVIEEVRQICPHCLVLFVYTGTPEHEPLADVSIDVSRGNEPLVKWLQTKLPRSFAAD